MPDETDHYTEVARRLMNELIEAVVAYTQGGDISPKELAKERAKHQREANKWHDANEQLKTNLKLMAEDNDRLEAEIVKVEHERDELRRQLNEYLMGRREVNRKLGEYHLEELMSPRAQEKWEEIKRLMTEVPYGGDKERE